MTFDNPDGLGACPCEAAVSGWSGTAYAGPDGIEGWVKSASTPARAPLAPTAPSLEGDLAYYNLQPADVTYLEDFAANDPGSRNGSLPGHSGSRWRQRSSRRTQHRWLDAQQRVRRPMGRCSLLRFSAAGIAQVTPIRSQPTLLVDSVPAPARTTSPTRRGTSRLWAARLIPAVTALPASLPRRRKWS